MWYFALSVLILILFQRGTVLCMSFQRLFHGKFVFGAFVRSKKTFGGWFQICSIFCPCWGLGKKSNDLRCFFLLASFNYLLWFFKQKDAMDEGEAGQPVSQQMYLLAKTHASLNSIMTSNKVIGDIQASRKSTGNECSIIQRHERTHYHHVVMTWCLLWIMLIAFDSFGLLVFCACRLASGVVVVTSVWVRYHALLECSCLVRFSISCTACWELFVWAICFLIFVLRILWSWAMRDVTDDWRLVVECLNQVWWMTFCSFGELCESTFNCNNQMSYFALSVPILILFSSTVLCTVALCMFSRHFEMCWNTCGDQGKFVHRIAFARDESDEKTMSRAYVFTVTRAWGGRQTSSTRSDHKTNQRRTPCWHRQHSGTVSAAVTKLVRPKPWFCSQGKRRLDVEAEGFDVSRLIVAQGFNYIAFCAFSPSTFSALLVKYYIVPIFCLEHRRCFELCFRVFKNTVMLTIHATWQSIVDL